MRAILKYPKHPSILAIKRKNVKSDNRFYFSHVTLEEVLIEIKKVDVLKAAKETDIPRKIAKENTDILVNFIFQSLNYVIVTSNFPAAFKLAKITPAFKKASKCFVENYRRVRILPDVSKIYEHLLFKEMNDYFEDLASKYQRGLRQWLSAQYCLITTLQKRKKFVDKGKTFAALLADLSKAFDCLMIRLKNVFDVCLTQSTQKVRIS